MPLYTTPCNVCHATLSFTLETGWRHPPDSQCEARSEREKKLSADVK